MSLVSDSYKSLFCPFHAKGRCNFAAENCIYSHDPRSVPIPDNVCLFYLRSHCFRGSTCPKIHRSVDQLLTQESSLDDEQTVQTLSPTLVAEPMPYATCQPSCTLRTGPIRMVPFQSEESTSKNNSTTLTDEKEKDTLVVLHNTNGSKSYANAASHGQPQSKDNDNTHKELCTFFQQQGLCYLPKCTNVHGEMCDLCGYFALHPYNENQRELHRQECIKEHEKNMEESFAYQRSKDLACGICLETVMEKESRKTSRFGILENCQHVYCIECIRTWRNSNFDKKNKRGCPQCRVKSDFVIPSEYFYDDKQEKLKIINAYKNALSNKHCKYFKQGQGKCPFEGACFYKHEYPDGRRADLPMPSERRRMKGTNGQEEYSLLVVSAVPQYYSLTSINSLPTWSNLQQTSRLDATNLRQILLDHDFEISDFEDFFFSDD